MERRPAAMPGAFDPAMAGKMSMVCELQITLKDFLHIKRLQHSYYDITRVPRTELGAFLLSSGPFIDPETLEEEIPSVVQELSEQSDRLSIRLSPSLSPRVLKSGMLEKTGHTAPSAGAEALI